MDTKRKNLVIGAGETFVLEGTHTDSNGNPVNLLNGYVVALIVSRFGNEVGTWTATRDGEGNYKFNIAKEETADWKPGRNSYRVVLQNYKMEQYWLQYGALTVLDGDRL